MLDEKKDNEFLKIVEYLGRKPNYLELSIYSVMWSEHCSYKSSRALLKNFKTTGKYVLQGPGENAGILDIGDGQAIVFKMESHNHPSAVCLLYTSDAADEEDSVDL